MFKIIVTLLLLNVSIHSFAFADEARDKKNKAIADFEKITVPNILAMAPHISKTKEERKAAINAIDTKLQVGDCYNAATNAVYGKENAALGAAKLCLAMKNWLNGYETRTCVSFKADSLKVYLVGEADKRIKRKLDSSNIMQIYNNLQTISGCKDKDAAFWSKRIISDYNEMYKLLDATPKENYQTIKPRIESLSEDCNAAGELRGEYSIVSETATYGCSAISFMVSNYDDKCQSIFSARWNGVRAAVNDPLKDDLLLLRVTYHQLTQKTNCEARVQELFAKWGTPKQEVILDPKIQAQINVLLAGFNQSMRSAQNNLDSVEIWLQYSVRSYKPGETNEEHEAARLNAIRSMCNYKTYARTNLYDAQVAARDIYKLDPSEPNALRFRQLKSRMEEINADIKRTCE